VDLIDSCHIYLLNMLQLSAHYNTWTDPQVSSDILELNRMKQIRESIARGGKILEVELGRLTERLSELEERLESATAAIDVMASEFREVWGNSLSDRLIEKHIQPTADESDDDETDDGSLAVQPAMTAASTLSSPPAVGNIKLPIVKRLKSSLSAQTADVAAASKPIVHPSSLGETSAVAPVGNPIDRPAKPLPRRALAGEFQPLPHIQFNVARMHQQQVPLSGAAAEFKRVFSDF
jgi:hypothetical protein